MPIFAGTITSYFRDIGQLLVSEILLIQSNGVCSIECEKPVFDIYNGLEGDRLLNFDD